MIPLRSYYSCHSGIVSQVVTRSMGKRRAAEMQTLEVMRPMEAAVSEPILLDLHIPAIVIEKIPEELTEVCVEHMEEIGSEASEMQTLEIAKLVETVVSENLLVDWPKPAIFTEEFAYIDVKVKRTYTTAIVIIHKVKFINGKVTQKELVYCNH